LLDIYLNIVFSFLIFEFTKHGENRNVKTSVINSVKEYYFLTTQMYGSQKIEDL